MTAPPREAVDLLAERIGSPVAADLFSDRRGSRTWKVHGPRGAVALKANSPESDDARDKAAEMAQEDRHLLSLIEAGALSSGYRVGAGAWEGGRWLAVRWIDGVPLWRAFALARGPEGDRPSVRPWLLGIARTWAQHLARLHAADWAHADVQPTNTLVTNDGRAAVIDYALSCGPAEDPIPYRGAITHTTAPEIADAILSTSDETHVRARPPADVWGLGASLFWCWTGQRPVPYEDAVDRAAKLRAIAQGHTIPLAEARPWPFPEFEHLITACMAPYAEDRPAAADIADMLAKGAR
ncbi:protein kinase [Streptomyces sp. TRM64462]|uniref:protein kinase domain-containing protein n=1 Tax=Streptomyces sp. TRM64462 TaxID=2741726 RepID=UPI001586A4FE|nr:protein kinase [Streptomyces sp. TRM64462]